MALYHQLTEINAKLSTQGTDVSELNDTASSQLTELESIDDRVNTANSWLLELDTKLGTIDTDTGNIATESSSTNTKLDTLITSSGNLETNTTSTNTKLDSVITGNTNIATNTTGTNTKLDSLIALTGDTASSRLADGFSWAGTTDAYRFTAEDYSSTYARGYWQNTTGATIRVKSVTLSVLSSVQVSAWNVNKLFNSTAASNTSRFRIGVKDSNSGNELDTDYMKLDKMFTLMGYFKQEQTFTGPLYLSTYVIPCDFNCDNNDYVSIRIQSDLSGETSIDGRAGFTYLE